MCFSPELCLTGTGPDVSRFQQTGEDKDNPRPQEKTARISRTAPYRAVPFYLRLLVARQPGTDTIEPPFLCHQTKTNKDHSWSSGDLQKTPPANGVPRLI